MKHDYLKISYNKKVDLSNYYTKSETDNAISSHTTNLSGYYTKAEIDSLLSQYAKSTSVPDMSNYVKYGDYVYFQSTNAISDNDDMYCITSSSDSGTPYERGTNYYFTINKY